MCAEESWQKNSSQAGTALFGRLAKIRQSSLCASSHMGESLLRIILRRSSCTQNQDSGFGCTQNPGLCWLLSAWYLVLVSQVTENWSWFLSVTSIVQQTL